MLDQEVSGDIRPVFTALIHQPDHESNRGKCLAGGGCNHSMIEAFEKVINTVMKIVTDYKTLNVKNQLGELVLIEAFLSELAVEWDLSGPVVFSINLALEEAMSNIINYGYDDDGQHLIELRFTKTGDELGIEIIDDGHEYDPTQRNDPDVTLPVEERPVGGLGIMLIKKLMDNVVYQRIENKNHLTFTKYIES
jgi:serine/threonine-protein kinase RsbW